MEQEKWMSPYLSITGRGVSCRISGIPTLVISLWKLGEDTSIYCGPAKAKDCVEVTLTGDLLQPPF